MTNSKSTTQADSKLAQSLRRAKTQKTTANKEAVKKQSTTTNKKAVNKPVTAPKKTETTNKVEPIASSERVWPD
ncbi:MAG: hypothetical protein L3J00_02785 [Thiomicrorhabdus sp.]|nr:hypothetical protein [Thiomicrorhabdus sp.]